MVPPSDTSTSTLDGHLATCTPLASTASVLSETDDQFSVYENANIGKIDNSDQHSITWESTIPDWPGNREPTEKDCLRSLLPDSNNGTVKIPRIQILPGTCEWLLKDETFKNWTSEHPSSRLLWLSGFPGTGKTAVMTFLLDWLRDRSPVVYFFCNDRDEEQRTVTAILKSLVRQLLQQTPSFAKYVMPEVELSRFGERKGWSAETLWEIFCKIAHDSEVDSIYCLVDALDECEETDGEDISRNELFKMLAELYSSNSACKLRIIFSSRPYARLQSFLTTVPAIQLRHGTTRQDLSQFIVSQLQKAFNNRFPGETRLRVEKHLLDEANGMFLPTSLIIRDLSNCFSDAEIDTLLATIPPSLFRYYDKLLGKIPLADRDRAKQMLMWVVYSPRPMTLEELNTALAVSAVATDSGAPTSLDNIKKLLSKDLKRELETRCGLFIQFREHGNGEYTVHLTHESVRNFFAGGKSMQLPSNFYEEFHVPKGDAHDLMGRTCITYLLFDNFSSNTVPTERMELKEYTKKYPFLEYSSLNWPHHLQRSTCLPPTIQEFLKFQTSKTKQFTHWTRVYNSPELPIHFDLTSFLPIHAVSFFGLTSLATPIINGKSSLASLADADGRSPLIWAARNGHKEMVKFLVGRSVPLDTKDNAEKTALHTAIENRHRELVEFLLEKGAPLQVKTVTQTQTYNSYYGRYDNTTTTNTTYTEFSILPLNLAIRAGDSEIAKLLVEKGATVSAKDKDGLTPLHVAVENENEVMVRFLLGRSGVNASAVDQKTETPLHYAVKKGSEEIVKLLLGNNTEVDAKDVNGETPFQNTVRKGNERIVRLLLDKGADVNGKYKNGETTLHNAIERGNKEIVELLLGKDVGVNIKDGKGETPLLKAVKAGNEEVVMLLLAKGVDIDAINGNGAAAETALHRAVSMGKEELVVLLLEKGVAVNSKDGKEGTALHCAVKDGNDDIVKLLLEKGADVNAINGSGATAETTLHRAVDMGKEEVVVWLLEKGAEINGKDGKEETPLHCAVKNGNDDIVKLLLDKGADVNATNGSGATAETALHRAVDMGKEEVVVWLLEKGAEVNRKDGQGEAPLQNAAKKGNEEIVRLLLKNGVDINAMDGNGEMGETALHWAVMNGHKDILKLLTENGAAANRNGARTLISAILQKEKEMVEILLKQGAKVNEKEKDGETALNKAIEMGNNDIVRLLLDYGADVKMANAGETALHLAVRQGNEEVVVWLLQKGAEVSAMTSNGETPLVLAAKKGYKEITRLLVDYM